VQSAACGIERVALAAAVPAGVLLAMASVLIQGVTGEAYHVEGIRHRHGIGQFLSGVVVVARRTASGLAVLKPVNPFIATTSTAWRQACGRSVSHCLNGFELVDDEEASRHRFLAYTFPSRSPGTAGPVVPKPP
jgi:hypothetical protein